jgi:hypothetical protein
VTPRIPPRDKSPANMDGNILHTNASNQGESGTGRRHTRVSVASPGAQTKWHPPLPQLMVFTKITHTIAHEFLPQGPRCETQKFGWPKRAAMRRSPTPPGQHVARLCFCTAAPRRAQTTSAAHVPPRKYEKLDADRDTVSCCARERVARRRLWMDMRRLSLRPRHGNAHTRHRAITNGPLPLSRRRRLLPQRHRRIFVARRDPPRAPQQRANRRSAGAACRHVARRRRHVARLFCHRHRALTRHANAIQRVRLKAKCNHSNI